MSPTQDHPIIRAEEERANRKRGFHFWESFWRVVAFTIVFLCILSFAWMLFSGTL